MKKGEQVCTTEVNSALKGLGRKKIIITEFVGRIIPGTALILLAVPEEEREQFIAEMV